MNKRKICTKCGKKYKTRIEFLPQDKIVICFAAIFLPHECLIKVLDLLDNVSEGKACIDCWKKDFDSDPKITEETRIIINEALEELKVA